MVKETLNGFNIEISFLIHATEDEKKLFDIIKSSFNLHPENFIQNVFKGHYGNPIYKYTTIVQGNLAQQIMKTVLERLDIIDKNILVKSIEGRVDDHKNLYLRIEKSSLFKKFFRLGTSNVIYLKLIPKNKKIENIKNFYENLIIGLENC
ncbi:MAG: RNA-binding domain-containing protein [Nitrososphaeria archaeon]